MKIINPANQEFIHEISEDSPKLIAEKYSKAKAAQKVWAKTPMEERLEIMRKFRAHLVSDEDRLAGILTREVGKPLTQAHNEVKGVLGRIDFFIEQTPKVLADRKVSAENPAEVISLEPLGVIVNISAWNYPYFVGANVFVPALLTGNAVLYKPSEFATLTGLAIEELLRKSGLPHDLFQVVAGGGGVGAALLEQPINGVFFTGSYATGKKIAETAGARMIKVQLELGGKDPAYVCDDADVKVAAASLADGAFYNTGQSCCSVERIYVHEKVYEDFLKAFSQEVKAFTIGDPMDKNTYIGPLTRAAQLPLLEEQVKDAVEKGAKLHIGGKRLAAKGANFFEPTVLRDCTHAMHVMRNESFGPIIGLQKVKNDEEALQLMNDTQYGLTAGVYTKSESRARSLLSEVNAGTAYWNCCDRVSPKLPWTGRNHSGIGCTLSTFGIETFTQPKAWHLKKL